MGHHKHNSSIKSFLHDVGQVTKPVGHIIADGFHTAEHVMTAPIHELASVGKSVGSNMTIPLVIGGVAVVFLLMQTRK